MNWADLFITCLEAHGVEYIFAVPGEENLDMLESLRTSSIKMIVTRNEQTAVFMAANYGRLTGKIGIALATLWPGATNMMTWVAYAQLGGMPVLVITGQKPVRASKQAKFQVIDVVAMMKPVTKFSTSIVDGVRIPSLVAHAIMTAESERPGAVHLELPEDIAWFTVDTSATPIVFDKIRRSIPDEKAIQSVISIIEQATCPMILIWAGANRKRVSKYLTQFIEQYNIPFFTSQMGKGVVDERLPQYLWTAALTSGDYLHSLIEQSDCILAIGHDTIEKPTHIIENWSTQVIHINFYPAEYDALYQPSLQIVGDIGNTMRQLCKQNINTNKRNFHQVYASLPDIQQKTYYINRDISYIWPKQLISDLRNILDNEDIVCLDNWLYKVRFARNYHCYAPNTLLLDNALATMGAGYSTAMITKILNPDRKVVAVVWDGWLVMNLGDLETLTRLGIDITVIVLNDNAYGMIKWKQHVHGYQDFWLDLHNPDFIQLAKSFGIKWYRISDPSKLHATLADVIHTSWVHLIEVDFMYPQDFK
jgi:acetolactate synthase-1/2/3 large subunit